MSQNIYELRFSHDWNTRKANGETGGKLKNLCFTTIRCESPMYAVGNIFRIINEHEKKKTEVVGYARCQLVHPFKLGELRDWIAFLDTGYNAVETIAILNRMYKNPPPSKPMVCCMLKYMTEKEVIALSEKTIQAIPHEHH
jgi:hypothetical protein